MHVASLYYPDVTVTVEDANRAPSVHGRDGPRVALTWTDFNGRRASARYTWVFGSAWHRYVG